jgi:hypothetical protein
MHNDEDDYKVGYKHPPRKHQYQPGKSGNPRGRPKKLNLGIPELIEKHLESLVTVKEGGETKRITAREAIVVRLLHDGARGEPKALELLLLLRQKTDVPQDWMLPTLRFVDPKWPGVRPFDITKK